MADAPARFDSFQRRRMTERPSTAAEIVDKLRKKFSNPYRGHKWALFPEMRLGTGWGSGNEQRIDLWVMGMWESSTRLEQEAQRR